jgi:hypothetical protein
MINGLTAVLHSTQRSIAILHNHHFILLTACTLLFCTAVHSTGVPPHQRHCRPLLRIRRLQEQQQH